MGLRGEVGRVVKDGSVEHIIGKELGKERRSEGFCGGEHCCIAIEWYSKTFEAAGKLGRWMKSLRGSRFAPQKDFSDKFIL